MRYLDPRCRLCRREGIKLFLKGERCFSPHCPLERKGAVPPGAGGKRKTRARRLSEFGLQLREKQKLKRLYQVSERQLEGYFKKARKKRQSTSEALFQILESRLDNLVYRLGLATSRAQARQLISHGFITVEGQKVNIPSFQVKPGEIVSLTSSGAKLSPVVQALAEKEVSLADWLERKAIVGRMKRLPKKEEVEANINEQAIVEYYSRR